MPERPPWSASRFRWVQRADGTYDVIDIGGEAWTDFPTFVANCENADQARRVVEALDA